GRRGTCVGPIALGADRRIPQPRGSAGGVSHSGAVDGGGGRFGRPLPGLLVCRSGSLQAHWLKQVGGSRRLHTALERGLEAHGGKGTEPPPRHLIPYRSS